jgi:hypothetical protein
VSSVIQNLAVTPISYASQYIAANGVTGQVYVGLGHMMVGTNTNHELRFATNRFTNPVSMTIESNGNVIISRPLTISSTSTFSGASTFNSAITANAGITANTGTITGNFTVNGNITTLGTSTNRNPSFSMRVTTAQPVTSNSLDMVIVIFATANWVGPGTTVSNFYSTTTGRLTVPTGFAGRWQIHSAIRMLGANEKRHIMQFLVNGFVAYESSGAFGVSGSTILSLAVGDYLEVGIYHDIGTTQNIFQGEQSQFVAHYLGAN